MTEEQRSKPSYPRLYRPIAIRAPAPIIPLPPTLQGEHYEPDYVSKGGHSDRILAPSDDVPLPHVVRGEVDLLLFGTPLPSARSRWH
jgi:hypothetical protein